MSEWERLVRSESTLRMYRNSPLFHLLVNKVRVAEESGHDPVVFLGEILATVCEAREEWMKKAIQALLEQPAPALKEKT